MKQRLLSLTLAAALCLGLAPVPVLASEVGGPAVSSNINDQDYSTWASTVKSYLFANDNGGLTRVEYIDGQITVEKYSSDFQLMGSRAIPMELSIWGGFFAGEDSNFFVFGQKNPNESDSVEVIRVVKYSKDWKRLGQASLYGANTFTPFDAGSLRMDEANGYLYVRTCHTMYTYSDGLNHQANMMFVVRESDMSVSDSFYEIAWTESGYVSHSFNQFIIIDEDGYPVTLDHGDASPTRGVAFRKYYANSSTGKFTGQQWGNWCSRMNLLDFGGSSGANATGASVGGLAEARDSYIFAFNYNGTGASGNGARTVYLQTMDIATGKGRQYKISSNTGTGSTTPQLAPTGLDGGYLLWNGKSGSTVSDTLYYLHYSQDGTPGEMQTATGALSDCAPVYYNGKVVWYVTDNSAPVFYTLDANGVTAHSTEDEEPEKPVETAKPVETETPTETAKPAPDTSDFVIEERNGEKWLLKYTGAGGDVVVPDGVIYIGPEAFRQCDNVTSVVLPESVINIQGSAFALCTNLASVTIPGSVKSIGPSAFRFCYNLTDVEIPEGVTDIRVDTFLYCKKLARVTIPASVTKIESNAFLDCTALNDVYYGGTEEQWKKVDVEGDWHPRIAFHFAGGAEPSQPTQPEVPVGSKHFPDVPANHWAYAYVENAAQMGWINGYDNGNFGPGDQVSYAQFYTMVIRAFFPDELAAYHGQVISWEQPYMTTALDQLRMSTPQLIVWVGIEYNPSASSVYQASINRTEMAVVISKAMEAKGITINCDRDAVIASIPDWDDITDWTGTVHDHVLNCVAAGIITGVDSNGTFNGSAYMTRAEAAVVLTRMAEVIENGGRAAS